MIGDGCFFNRGFFTPSFTLCRRQRITFAFISQTCHACFFIPVTIQISRTLLSSGRAQMCGRLLPSELPCQNLNWSSYGCVAGSSRRSPYASHHVTISYPNAFTFGIYSIKSLSLIMIQISCILCQRKTAYQR